MSDYFFFFLVLLALIAAILRADFVLTIIYLLCGIYIVGRWWSRRALNAVRAKRIFNPRAFYGEKVPVALEIQNTGWLPLVWLQFQESLPVELTSLGSMRRVITLGGFSKVKIEYEVEGRKRGYYPIGPLTLFSGDLFGVSQSLMRQMPLEHLTVYPKIVPLNRVRLPSNSPLGTLRHAQPVFEDPSRVMGKRDYTAGDSLRSVDWKATANTGRMQVKLFEPSIALETAIFLNLNTNEYDLRYRFDAPELAIVVAASLANWVIAQRQAVGLVTNGVDPLSEGSNVVYRDSPPPIEPRRGRGHLMHILDLLARIQPGETLPMVQTLQRVIVGLPWGATLILITPCIDHALFDGLFQARRAGLNAVLVPCGPLAEVEEIRRQAAYFGFPLYQIYAERDLDMWRL